MDRLIYTALSGMRSSMNQQRVIANNMANTNTPGFRAELLDQRSITLKGDRLDVRIMQQGQVRSARMAAGEVVQTDQPLDIAINSDALISVQAPNGKEAYTRRGDLLIAPTGLLVTGEGHPVMGEGGPITVPIGGKPTIAADGTIMVMDPSVPDQAPQEVGRIKLAAWQGSPIIKGIDNLFRVEGGGILPTDEEATLTTGALEQSNVKPTEVLVEMIEAQRLFAMHSKLISTASDCDASGAQLMRLS